MIERQVFALDMEALTSRFQRLHIEDKVVTLVNELWDEMCINTTERRKVEIPNDENGMETMVGKLLVPTFYFMSEKKFWRHLKNILKVTSTIQMLAEDQHSTKLCKRLD